MEEVTKVLMIERVCVAKFDHTDEDCPTVPFTTVTQETVTEVSLGEALLMGWQPKEQQVEATATVQIGGGDHAGVSVGD